MLPIQEILVLTNKDARLTIHIIKPNECTSFSAEIFVFDPDFNASDSFQLPISGSYKSSSKAFDDAFTWVVGWLQTKGLTVSKINNPCNTEFLSVAEQQAIVSKHGVQAKVEINK
jgi:hypothetical protein